jgi:4'-phosphopantetheinyl transferase EntD
VELNSIQKYDTEILDKIFPYTVSGIILPIDNYISHLHPDEYKFIRTASNKRKLEFSTGRRCAAKALSARGISNAAIPAGENREPVWPPGIIGSISHCKDKCGAVIAGKSDLKSIGFDIESIKTLKNDIGRVVCTNREKKWLKDNRQQPYNVLMILIFSLKESVYKCIYQAQQIKLGFKDINIIPDLDEGTAEIVFNKELDAPNITLRFFITNHHIYSGATCL